MRSIFSRTAYAIMSPDKKYIATSGKWGPHMEPVKSLRVNATIKTYPQKAMAQRVIDNDEHLKSYNAEVVELKESYSL